LRLAWVTDIHLDFIDADQTDRFFAEIAETGADGVLVGGDIAQAASVQRLLRGMSRRVEKPIWFVLGNHDFYGGSIAGVREGAIELSRGGRIVWLGAASLVELSPRAALVGHDGWGDARLGNAAGTPVLLNDFYAIAELAGADRPDLTVRLRRLGDEAAAHMERVLPEALERYGHVLVLTHVPPFREACWHRGRLSDDDWLPYFTCKAVGDVLISEATRRPDRQITVLCGHTHSGGECHPLPNLRAHTGAAEYGLPTVQYPLLKV
jgi:3',5'-cyclic AMP phosphodiesterase CpdA